VTFALAVGWASPASAQARMWVIRDADSTIYVMGTIMLRSGVNWRSPKIDSALKEATELWLETPDGEPSAQDDQDLRALMTAGLSSAATISELLSPDDRKLWLSVTESVSAFFPVREIERLRPWAASKFVDIAHGIQAGYDVELGVEDVLSTTAREQGDTIKGLESVETAAALMRSMIALPEKQQLDVLRLSLKSLASDAADRATDAWAHGNVTLIEAQIGEMRANSPAQYEIMIAKRNENWAGQIQDLLKGAGVSFIAVGAGHLVGPDSLQLKLKAKGIDVADY